MDIITDARMPKLPAMHRGRWVTFYGEWGNGVTTVARELAVFLSSQYRVALVHIQPRKGVLISRSPRGNWKRWARRGGTVPHRERFLLVLPAPVKRVGKPQRLVLRAFPRARFLLEEALRAGRLDYVVMDGGFYVGFEPDIFQMMPGRHVAVSSRADKTCDVRTRWQEGQPPGRLATIPEMPALARECEKRGIPMVYASQLLKRVFWELAVNLFAQV